jgi:glycosyltransferase involved in cell wall biosynthesis
MSHSLRIALFHNLPSGGAKRAIFEWVRLLAQCHKIDVYTLSGADHNYCDIRPLVNAHYIWDFVPRRLYNSPFGRLNQYQRWRDLATLTRLEQNVAKEINRRQYDIAFLQPCVYTYTPALTEYLKIPSIYYLHEAFGPTCKRIFKRPYQRENAWRQAANHIDPLIALYQHRLESIRKHSLRHTTRMLANSHFTQEWMKHQYGVSAAVCYLGVDSDHFHPLHDIEKQNVVLSVGELSPRKGFDFLVEGLARIPIGERPLLKLVCNTVDVVERAYITDLATRLGVHLSVLTNLNIEQMTLEYNQARLCVYAPIAEPFGLVPLEALACGTPVVGVAEGGVLETIRHEHTGLLTPRNPEQFAISIRSLLADPERCALYGRNGRQDVLKNWSWEVSTKAIEKHLLETADKT